MIKKENIKTIDIPEDGSLGLLAYGDIGLKIWREKREQVAKEKAKTNKKAKKDE